MMSLYLFSIDYGLKNIDCILYRLQIADSR
jgi:hypothetical protein